MAVTPTAPVTATVTVTVEVVEVVEVTVAATPATKEVQTVTHSRDRDVAQDEVVAAVVAVIEAAEGAVNHHTAERAGTNDRSRDGVLRGVTLKVIAREVNAGVGAPVTGLRTASRVTDQSTEVVTGAVANPAMAAKKTGILVGRIARIDAVNETAISDVRDSQHLMFYLVRDFIFIVLPLFMLFDCTSRNPEVF